MKHGTLVLHNHKRMGIGTINQWVLVLLPFLLTASCLVVFKLAAGQFGNKWGYLAGFLFYWIGWCITVPLLLVGTKGLVPFLRPVNLFDWKILLCLLPLLVFVYAYAFPKVLPRATALIIVLSLVLSLFNAFCEEVLWRATYISVFGDSRWMSILFASIDFAVWHYAPQVILVNKNPGGAHSFVAFAFVLGLCYAYVAWRQQSIFWTTVTHTLFDFAGLGALFYFSR